MFQRVEVYMAHLCILITLVDSHMCQITALPKAAFISFCLLEDVFGFINTL